MKWQDTSEIVYALMEKYPEQDPKQLHFVHLHQWILALDDFDDDPESCNEKILEAIQMFWLEEMDD